MLSAAYGQACNHLSNFSERILHCMIDATLHSHKLSTHFLYSYVSYRKRGCINHNSIPKHEELPILSRLEVLKDAGSNAYACSLADEVSSKEEVLEFSVVGSKRRGDEAMNRDRVMEIGVSCLGHGGVKEMSNLKGKEKERGK
ncbi:hypothetical protein FF1_008154 [Malus domestica]